MSMLFKITELGVSAVVGGGYRSDMAGFGSTLSDDQIMATLEYIRSIWPKRERAYHEEMNRREVQEAK
jgi:mono/diheme cytochrome c family protein